MVEIEFQKLADEILVATSGMGFIAGVMILEY